MCKQRAVCIPCTQKKTQKLVRIGAPDLLDLSTFLSVSTKYQNIEGGPFRDINNFSKRVSQCRKTWKRLFGIFQHSFFSQNIKKVKRWPFGEKKSKKVSNAKKWKGSPFSLACYCMFRWKEGTTFLVHFTRSIGPIWHLKVLLNFVEIFWSVRVKLKRDASWAARYFPL